MNREARAEPEGIRLPLESGGTPEPPRRSDLPLVLAVALGAGVVSAFLGHSATGAWSLVMPRAGNLAPLWAGLLGSALTLLSCAILARRRVAPRLAVTRAWLSIDEVEIARLDDKGRTSLARWGQPFGLSVLSNTARSRALLVFTTPMATRFLGLRLETAKDADATRDLMAHAITVPDADLELAAGPAQDVRLSAASACVLLGELTRRDDQATQRIYLSDARGTAIVLERESLELDGHTFDLSAAIDWRVFTFNEGEPGVLTLYQATAIRQGGKELVLVCRAPEELASWGLGRTVDTPPPRETRVAIDRLFMTPLRAALERAPRVSRSGISTRTQGKSVQT